MGIKIVFSKSYNVDIGPHVFPTSKYGLVKDALIENGLSFEEDFIEPEDATLDEILLAHSREYLEKLLKGALSEREIALLELPYSRALIDASIRCAGGSILAAKLAISECAGIHIGGGFHHAFRDHGEGFCVLNDIAIAIKALLKKSLIKKALVIDCDLHQGNGTARIFRDDKDVFTFSIHQENNYPFYKEKSLLDIGLAYGADDSAYIGALKKAVPDIIDKFKPDFIMYVAGADIYQFDRLGGLDITMDGIKLRDEFIFNEAKKRKIPVAVVLAGGYAEDVSDTVKIHFNTINSGIKILCQKNL